jgi:hypothetical protein
MQAIGLSGPNTGKPIPKLEMERRMQQSLNDKMKNQEMQQLNQRVTNTTRRRRNANRWRLHPNANPRGFTPTRGRGRRNNNNNNRTIVGLGLRPYALHHTIKQQSIDYAEAVVCPFNQAAIGSLRPDEVTNTAPATDKVQGVVPITAINQVFQSPAVQDVWPGVTLTGIMFFLMPRSNKSGFWEARSITNINTQRDEIKPTVNSVGLDPTLTSNNEETRYNLGWPYVLCASFLGSNGLYYCYAPAVTGTTNPINLATGYNTLRSTRMNLIYDNFNSLRILGMGLKVWSNAPPIQTGGYTWGGEISLQDLYRAMTATNDGLSSQVIQDAIKNRSQYSGLDGVTLRYNTVVEPIQTKIKEVYIDDIIRKSSDTNYEGSAQQNYITQVDAYEITKATELQSKDLATNSTLVPCLVWQFGSGNYYDLTFNSIWHLEGRTVGSCPFELSSEIIDPNIKHLDKFLRSTAFPITAKGHSFRKFIEKAQKIVGRASHFATNSHRIIKLIEEFLGKI